MSARFRIDPVVDAGRLDERLQLKRLTETSDAAGQLQPTETTLATVWGCVEELVGDEQVISGKLGALANRRVTIRHYDGLTVKDFVYRELTSADLNIMAIKRVGGPKAFMELECVEEL